MSALCMPPSRALPTLALLALSLLGLRGAPLAAEPPAAAKPGDTIGWVQPVTAAYEAAAREKKPLMICINSERVDGGRVEAAAKELREATYKDPAVVTRSREFVCCFLTSGGSSDDFGELRARYQIEGLIVSPQHIFAFPDGTLIGRHEYWPHGTGERSVKALLGLMDGALARVKAQAGLPPTPPTPAPGATPEAAPLPAPGGGDAATVQQQLLLAVAEGPTERRKEALRRLLFEDKDGTNLQALLGLWPQLVAAKDVAAQVDVVRALGRPGLVAATPLLGEALEAKDVELRANAAVSLEYVGDPAAADALKGRLDREKDELVLCHVMRALGRCAAADPEKGSRSSARSALDKRVASSKTEALSCAATIGLAYFDKDPAAARALEEHLQKVGVPAFGRRGGQGANTQKRTYLAWALAEVGDPKSSEFMRKKMLPAMDNVDGGWLVQGIRTFYDAVADVCEGKAEQMATVEGGVQFVIRGAETPLKDDARRGRDDAGFTPLADWDPGAGGQGGPGGFPGGLPGGNPGAGGFPGMPGGQGGPR